MAERDQYFLGYRRAEQERLQRQAEQLGHEATRLFADIGLSPGARALEIGCGPRGCLDILSTIVGPSGSVVGVERSDDAVALAREFVAARRLGNVEVLCGDARSTGLPNESFDLVTARLVLVNVPSPEQIVSQAAALTKAGGTVAFHEVDWAAMICDPPSDAWTTLVDLFVAYTRKNGMDLYIGRRLPRLLRDAGLVDVQVTPIVHVHPPGDPRRTILMDFAEGLRTRIVAENLIAEAAYDELKDTLKRHLDDPETLVVVGPYFQAWGRKPARSDAR